MEKVIKVAAYICKRYKEQFRQDIDEMKLHKLLYFAQREALIRVGEPMFAESFQAWRLGPVMPAIREFYHNGMSASMPSDSFLRKFSKVFDFVFAQYATKPSISLSDLSHGEYSWKHAREGLGLYDSCTREMKIEDIRIDAANASKRRVMLSVLKRG